MADFEVAVGHTIGLEGGYVNDRNDPGGETKYGISKRAFPEIDIKRLTLQEAKEIYRRHYWEPLRLSEISRQAISAEIFDTAVNCGAETARKIAQDALRYLGEPIPEDATVFGPVTIAALNRQAERDPKQLLLLLNCLQFYHYFEIVKRRPESRKFARGWLKRIQLTPA